MVASVAGTVCQAVRAPRSHQNGMAAGSSYDTPGTCDRGVVVNGSSRSSGAPMWVRSSNVRSLVATRRTTSGSR